MVGEAVEDAEDEGGPAEDLDGASASTLVHPLGAIAARERTYIHARGGHCARCRGGGGGARRWRRRSVWNRVMQCLARVNGERVSAAAVVGGREGRRRCCRAAQWLGAQTSFPLPSRSSWQGEWPIQPTVAGQGRGASTTTIDLSATTRCTGDHNVFDTEPAGRDRGETRQTRRTEATARTATEGLQQQPAEHRGCSRSRGHDAGHTPSTD